MCTWFPCLVLVLSCNWFIIWLSWHDYCVMWLVGKMVTIYCFGPIFHSLADSVTYIHFNLLLLMSHLTISSLISCQLLLCWPMGEREQANNQLIPLIKDFISYNLYYVQLLKKIILFIKINFNLKQGSGYVQLTYLLKEYKYNLTH